MSERSATAQTHALSVSKIRYQAQASMDERGVARSVERSIFSVSPRGDGQLERLDEATLRAANAYVWRVRKMSFGLLGNLDSLDEDAPSIYLRPIRFMLMGFSVVEPGAGPGEYQLKVCRGLLCSKHAQEELMGALVFRWWREGSQEVFETEMRDYTPMWMGKRATWWRKLFYQATQMTLHRLVMWRYHVWVQRERSALLGDAPSKLDDGGDKAALNA